MADLNDIPGIKDLLSAALRNAAVDADGLVLRNQAGNKIAVALSAPGDALPVSWALLTRLVKAGGGLYAMLPEYGDPTAVSDDPEIQAVYIAMMAATQEWDAAAEALTESIKRTFSAEAAP